MTHSSNGFVAAILVTAGAVGGPASAQQAREKPRPTKLTPELRRRVDKAVAKGLEYLAATQQADGGWQLFGKSDPAITALAARCFIQSPAYGPRHPVVKRAIEYVLKFRQPDGGLYAPEAGLPNYYTCVCLATLASMNDASLQPTITEAQQALKKLQWDEGEDIDQANAWYGGAGYGQHKRPDLSNTQMMIEALRESGLPADDPTIQKALRFVSRCQMSSHSNDQPFARGAQDGGFIYTAANDGESKAGEIVIEGRGRRLRSYGSMTYAGFKSMLYADVDRKDPRVVAALNWIRKYYTLDSNPNMPHQQSRQGLYYYYHVFAKAMRAWGEPTITDAQGIAHDWRADLFTALLKRQARDGSWVNDADRWYEGNPALVTAYSILAIQASLG
jgi:squalene-hopene/tetraprenyl-beta-curcumene cyclase